MQESASRPPFNLMETCVGVITAPVPTLRRVCQERPVGWAILMLVVVSLLSGIAQAALPLNTLGLRGGENLGADLGAFEPIARAGTIVLIPMFTFFAAVIYTGVYYVMSHLLGGQGRYASLFSGLSFSLVPQVLLLPFAVFPLALGSGAASIVGYVLYWLAASGIGIWILVLDVIVIKEANGFSVGRAIVAFIVPLLAFVMLAIILAVLALVIVAITIGSIG